MAQRGQYLIDSEEKATDLAKKGAESIIDIVNNKSRFKDLKTYVPGNLIERIYIYRNQISEDLTTILYKRRLVMEKDVVVLDILLNLINKIITTFTTITQDKYVKANQALLNHFKSLITKSNAAKELFLGSKNILSKKDFNASKPNEDAAKNSSTSKEEVLKILKSNFGKIQNMDGQFGKYESYINTLDNSNPHKAKLKAFCDYYRNGLIRKLYWALENTISQTEKLESNFLPESVKLFNYYLAQLTAPYPEDIKFAKPADLNGITAYVGSFISQVQPSLTQLASKFKNG